jgi:hypothetical protein
MDGRDEMMIGIALTYIMVVCSKVFVNKCGEHNEERRRSHGDILDSPGGNRYILPDCIRPVAHLGPPPPELA